MGRAGPVQALHGPGDFNANQKIFEPIAEFGGIEMKLEILVTELGRGKPFAFLFLAFDGGDGQTAALYPVLKKNCP